MTARSYRTWAWVALGAGSGWVAIALVYAAQLVVAGRTDLAMVLELHRRWPAFLVLDGLPILLAWIGWLAGSLRATEAALTETRAVLGPFADPALASTILDPVLLVDAEARIVAANPAASALLEAENLVGTALREVLPDLDRADLGSSERSTRSGRLVGVLWQMNARRADGSSVAVNVSCGPAAGNRVLYVLVTEGPRSADRELEERLLRERDDARGAVRSKSLFLAGFAGELRGRLDRVAGIAAAGGDGLGPAVQRAAALVDAVTDLGRMESGRLAVLADAVPVDPILADVARVGQALAACRGSSVTARPAGPITVRADGVRLEEVLAAVVDNACRATKNGAIRIVAGPDPDNANLVRIDVMDNGTGMPPEQVAHLFEEETAPRRFGGITLVLCAKLVARMGGTMSVKSTFGSGTTVTVRLAAAASPATDLVRPEDRRPVVIVDRQPEPVRTRLRERLARAGIHPVIWLTGEPQELAALDPWAVAIDLDVGEELLSEIVGNPVFAGIPIVAATSTVHDRARTLPGGVSALLDAPFDPHELVPALIRADRAVRGCVLHGTGEGADKVRRALADAGFTVRTGPAPRALAVWVDAEPEPGGVMVRSSDPQAAVDRVCLATRRGQT